MRQRTFYGYNFLENKTYPDEVMIKEPRQCMHCDQTGIQNFIVGTTTNGKHDQFSGISLYKCSLCESTTVHFSLYFEQFDMVSDSGHQSIKTVPEKKEKIETISDELQDNFPDFFEIYSQSESAEKANLNQIAGMGYRKALEFLVTDYLIAYPVKGVEEDWLKDPKTSLGKKILKIESTRIQNLARAISFIGNDETHYSKRHPEHDIDSMKAFIRVLLSEIQNEIDYKNAEELINKPKS